MTETAPAAPARVSVQQLTKTYVSAGGRPVEALSGLSFEVGTGEFVTLVGPSGCGKTTLLYLIAGLQSPTSGRILLNGAEVHGSGRDRGMVFQQDALLLWRKVIGNVEFGLEIRGVPKDERRRVALDALRLVGLEDYADFHPKELSGGMKKRAAIAAVLANSPDVLLMDEPFGSLDYPSKVALQDELLKIWERTRVTTLFVTHDIEEATYLADRVIVIQKGSLREVIRVDLPRPRTQELRDSSDFQELKGRLWKYIS